jgi:hypothetical protein
MESNNVALRNMLGEQGNILGLKELLLLNTNIELKNLFMGYYQTLSF